MSVADDKFFQTEAKNVFFKKKKIFRVVIRNFLGRNFFFWMGKVIGLGSCISNHFLIAIDAEEVFFKITTSYEVWKNVK